MKNQMFINEYKKTVKRMLHLNFSQLTDSDLENAIDYSINKRFRDETVQLEDNYRHEKISTNLSTLVEFIMKREPICTAYGVLFKKHIDEPNPVVKVTKSFLEKRSQDKKKMYNYPKGSEEYEHYNLYQQLDKIDANGVYGILGLYVSLLYNLNVAPSVTSQGRSLVSAAGMQFEMFLANSVKFGSLDEVVVFIDHVRSEVNQRHFKDSDILDRNISHEDCMMKIAWSCGYHWIPSEEELEIIWSQICKLSQEDINRIYYKNNLYEFMKNNSMIKAIQSILRDLDEPFMAAGKPPESIIVQLDVFADLLMEYVYYSYQIIDRIDRMDQMPKNVCLISDTDSTIISLDAWFRFVESLVHGEKLRCIGPCFKALNKIYESDIDEKEKDKFANVYKYDEFGDIVDEDGNEVNPFQCINNTEKEWDYDFYTEEAFQRDRLINPIRETPFDYLRYSILNIMGYVLDKIINDYMIKFTKQMHSWSPDKKCAIIMKNEYTFKRILLTMVKKNYAAIQEVQEGKYLGMYPDIKGLPITKTTLPKETRNQLKNILIEDILKSAEIDQVKILKRIAIFERQIYNSLSNGEKTFLKPLAIKSASSYDAPMSEQGIKASYVWNAVRNKELPAINLDERNHINIAKVKCDRISVDTIKEDHPEEWSNLIELMKDPYFSSGITAIAIPADSTVPEWLRKLIDYTTIINDNISTFPLESIGIYRCGQNHVNYTNMIQL